MKILLALIFVWISTTAKAERVVMEGAWSTNSNIYVSSYPAANPYIMAGGSVTINGNAFSVGGSSFSVTGGSATVAYAITLGSIITEKGVGTPAIAAINQGVIDFNTTNNAFQTSQGGGDYVNLISSSIATTWLPVISFPQNESVVAVTAINTLYCYRFVMPYSMTVGQIAVDVVGGGTPTKVDAGIWADANAGAPLLTLGGPANSAGIKKNTAVKVVLQAGTPYRYCFCSGDTTATHVGFAAPPTTDPYGLANTFLAATGTGANSCTGGAIGVIATGAISTPAAVFKTILAVISTGQN